MVTIIMVVTVVKVTEMVTMVMAAIMVFQTYLSRARGQGKMQIGIAGSTGDECISTVQIS